MTDTGMIDNTSEAWGAMLLKLADEARSDAAQRDSAMVLAQTLDDLSRVLESYAARLGVERMARRVEAASKESVNPGAAEMINKPPPAAEAVVFPNWLRDTLRGHAERIGLLEAKAADMSEVLGNVLSRLAWLEDNAGQTSIAVPQEYVPDTPHDPEDYNPDAWGSIERARTALSNQVHREWRRQAGLRQQVLNAVAALAGAPDLTDDDRAQLAQHKARADRLDQIDSVRDVKLDEIANLDDLAVAKQYRADVGWPR